MNYQISHSESSGLAPERREIILRMVSNRAAAILKKHRASDPQTSGGQDGQAVSGDRTQNDVSEDETPKVIQLPKFEPIKERPNESFAAMQEWEGIVTEIAEDSFSADLIDITAGDDIVSETAEIPFFEISPTDKQSLKVGMIFRWAVGFNQKASGNRARQSLIYFRRGGASVVREREPLSQRMSETARVL